MKTLQSTFKMQIGMTTFLALLLLAQQAKGQQAAKDNQLFVDDSMRAAAGAAGAVGMRNPAGVAGIILAGKGTGIWDSLPAAPLEKAAAADKAPPVDPDLLSGVEERAPVRSAAENFDEFKAYNYLLVLAHKTSVQALAKGARRDLTFAHLFEEPEKYRGQIVHVEGHLKRLRKFDSARLAAKEGVPVLYEGWVFDEVYYYNPFCVIVSELPKSIEIGDKIDHQVSFDGYFFKRYLYKAGDGLREAPLLIGRTLSKLSTSPSAAPESPGLMLPSILWIFLGGLGITAALGIGLIIWFMRGDRRVRARLNAARDAGFVDPSQSSDLPP